MNSTHSSKSATPLDNTTLDEATKLITELLNNRIGYIDIYYHPDTGIPEWLEPYRDKLAFRFKGSPVCPKGKALFVDTQQLKMKVEKDLWQINILGDMPVKPTKLATSS